MTLIVSVATEKYVVQVGDTRVSLLHGDGTVTVGDDHKNKLTYFDGRIVFGYTGLAELEGTDTATWINHQISGKAFANLAEPVQRLALRATEAVRLCRVAPRFKHLAIVGVGLDTKAFPGKQIPLIWRVSNFHGEDGRRLSSPLQECTAQCWSQEKTRGLYRIELTGAAAPQDRIQRLRATVRNKVKRGKPPAEVVIAIVRFIRDCAKSNQTIGERLVSAYLPVMAKATVVRVLAGGAGSMGFAMKDSDGKPISVMIGGTFDDAACFHYWPINAQEPKGILPGIAGREISFPDPASLISTLYRRANPP